MYKLLIVDDELIERRALKHFIEDSGLDIISIEDASNGRQAIVKSLNYSPDIIIMDIKMPGINGLEAAKEIRNRIPECRIIFSTAFDYFEYANEALRIGAVDFIVKPARKEAVIETLSRAVQMLNEKNSKRQKYVCMKKKLTQYGKYFESRVINLLLKGDTDKELLEECFRELNVVFRGALCVVAKLDKNDLNTALARGMSIDIIKRRCIEKIRAELEITNLQNLIDYKNGSIYIFLLLQDFPGNRTIKKFCNTLFTKVCRIISEQIGIKAYIGIGKGIDKIENAGESFFKAEAASRNCNRDKEIIFFETMPYTMLHFRGIIEKEKELCDRIARCDEKQTVEVLEDIFDDIVLSSVSRKQAIGRIYETMVAVNRFVLKEFGMNMHNEGRFFKDINQAGSISDANNYFKKAIIRTMKEISGDMTGQAASLINEICVFIHDNYMKHITLDEVSDRVGFSKYYLSKLFKYHKKMNFIDYLTCVRIEKAKELLSRPNSYIKEVSSQVGYRDPNYFSNTFKKHEGITPTEYRAKKQKSISHFEQSWP